MIAIIQRVFSGEVRINHHIYSSINSGYVIFLGVCNDDSDKDVAKLATKIITLRIMVDENGKMNRSILDAHGELLIVSEFTLCADTSSRRPSFAYAKKPGEAEKLYGDLVNKLSQSGLVVKTGQFGAKMQVKLVNDGPVTIIINTQRA